MNKRWEFNPGSPEAIERGCICAVLDNGHGRGRGGDGEKYGWYVTVGCPVHDAEDPKESSGGGSVSSE